MDGVLKKLWFLKMDGVLDKRTGFFENGQSVLISKLSEKWHHRVNSLYVLGSLPVDVESH